ncbi:MAG: hypothetical protein AB7F82_06130, partial [Alphaproteobacteria bacterium]
QKKNRMYSRISSILPPAYASFVFLVAFIGYVVAGQPVFLNPDIPWHIAAGDLFRANGIIATNDPWSYSAGHTPWYDVSWLWDILLSWLNENFGVVALYYLAAFLLATILALLCVTLHNRRDIPQFFILLTLMVVWYVQLAFMYAQPVLMSMLFVVIFHHFLHQSRTAEKRSLLVLPLFMLGWVNMHGGFIIGFALIAIYALEAWETQQRAWFRRLVWCAAACAATSLINPNHIFLYDAAYRVMVSPINPYLIEWKTLTIGDNTSFSVIILLLFVVTNLRDVRIPLADRILALLWLLYALHAQRAFAVLALVAAPYLAYSWYTLARHAQPDKVDANVIVIKNGNKEKLLGATGIVLALLLCTATPVFSALVPKEKLADDPYGVRAAMAVVEQKIPGARVLNDFNIGGYLIYNGRGEFPVFLDGRAGTAYPNHVMEEYITLMALEPGHENIIARYDINAILTPNFGRLYEAAKASPHWKRIYTTESISAFKYTQHH